MSDKHIISNNVDEQRSNSLGSRGSDNSNVRNMTNRNHPSDRSKEKPKQVDGNVASARAEVKPEMSHAVCTTFNMAGATICATIIVAWVFFVFWADGGADLKLFNNELEPTSSPSWNPPTSEQCTAISNGTLIDNEPHERLRVNLELQFQAALVESNVTSLELDWKNKLQQHVMPKLAGCESVSRRLRLGGKSPVIRQREQRRKLLSIAPTYNFDYIISHAVVEDSILSWNETVAKEVQMTSDLSQPPYTYPLAVDVLLWVRDEGVTSDFLVEKVSQVLRQFLGDTSRLTDLQLAASKLIGVEQRNTTNENQETTGPNSPATSSPSTMPSSPDIVTNPPVATATMAPSNSPIVMNIGNVTEPTVTDSPTVAPIAQTATFSPTVNATT